MTQKWSPETVVSAIMRLHEAREPLNSGHVQVEHKALYLAACTYHGGWKQAIEASGLSYDSVRVKEPKRKVVWNKSIVTQAIQALHERAEPLNSNHAQTKHRRLYGAAYKYFGSWSQAVTAAGFDYGAHRKKRHRLWSRGRIVEAVIARFSAGKPMNGPIVAQEDRGLYNAARRHFGTGGWAKARILAGLPPTDPNPKQIWNEQTVVAEIRRLHESGVPLYITALQKSGYYYLLSAGRDVFGSWAKAIEASGLSYEEIRKCRKNFWTAKEVVRGIRELESLGTRLSSKAIHASHGALFAAAVAHFGCWSQAVEAAGISYRQHCRIWSTKAWLRRMSPGEYTGSLERSRNLAQTRRRATS